MVDANLALIVCESNRVGTRQRDIQDFRISSFGFSAGPTVTVFELGFLGRVEWCHF